VLYPEAEGADLDAALSPTQIRWLLGDVSPRAVEAVKTRLEALMQPKA
jgi:hypothetical protein